MNPRVSDRQRGIWSEMPRKRYVVYGIFGNSKHECENRVDFECVAACAADAEDQCRQELPGIRIAATTLNGKLVA